jgi:hypothetical protein
MNEEQKIAPIANKDEEKEVQQQVEDGIRIRNMVETVGWSKVLAPKLFLRRESLVKQMLGCVKHEDFVMCQQGVNAIDNIFIFVKSTIDLGVQAVDRIEAHKAKEAAE